MNNRPPVHPFLPPILIGIVSALGLCLIAAYVWFPRGNAGHSQIQFPTLTPFKYALLATETPLVTESPDVFIPEAPTAADESVPPLILLGPTPADSTGTQVSSEGTSTGEIDLSRCSPAPTEYFDPVLQTVLSMNGDNDLTHGWIVSSNDVFDLLILAAQLHGPEVEADPVQVGVWGLFLYEDGSFDIYSINESAQDLSYNAYGTNFEPALTMNTDGAQVAYDCAANSP